LDEIGLRLRLPPVLGEVAPDDHRVTRQPGELHTMKNLIAKFVKDESGATAIEYGLIAAGISLAIIAIVNGLGSNLNTKFTNINSSLK
jgi:pilus assembly protein Flp/PilA